MLQGLRPPPEKIGSTFKISVRVSHPYMMPTTIVRQTAQPHKRSPRSQRCKTSPRSQRPKKTQTRRKTTPRKNQQRRKNSLK